MTATEKQTNILPSQARTKILRTIKKLVTSKFINIAGVNLDQWAQDLDQRAGLFRDDTNEGFENGVRLALNGLKSSHTAFYHGVQNRFPPQHSINATLKKLAHPDDRWIFIDVFPEGPADQAGIRPGDVLLKVNGVGPGADSPPQFQMGNMHELTVSDLQGGHVRDVSVTVPLRKGNKQRPPIVEPKAVTTEFIQPNIGLLRIPYFSGTAGMRFGRELAAAISGLKDKGADRLVIDLRGNIGGSLGFAILASYLCPDQRPIGYSVTPKALRDGYSKENLPKVPMPRNKAELLLTLGRFALRDKSVVLMTQGLGAQPFHGRVAILIDEFTHSAGEMIASFAAENHLATLIGTKTSGNVLGAVNFGVGYEYFVRLPVFGWFTWAGDCLEGKGVTPEITVAVNHQNESESIDPQGDVAVNAIRKI